MREEFEGWYIETFLWLMKDASLFVCNLRRGDGGYDDHHIDGAWECWKFKAAKNG